MGHLCPGLRSLLPLDGHLLVWHLSQEVFEEEKGLHEAILEEALEKMWESVCVEAQQGCTSLHTCRRLDFFA